jgi:rubredoxin
MNKNNGFSIVRIKPLSQYFNYHCPLITVCTHLRIVAAQGSIPYKLSTTTTIIKVHHQKKMTMNTKSIVFCIVSVLMMIATSWQQSTKVVAFTPATFQSSIIASRGGKTSSSAPSQLYLFGQQPKDDGSPGDYVCKDCGYVFTKGPKAWAELDDKYKCPPCGAPKFRFKKVPKGSASGTKVEVRKNWFGK